MRYLLPLVLVAACSTRPIPATPLPDCTVGREDSPPDLTAPADLSSIDLTAPPDLGPPVLEVWSGAIGGAGMVDDIGADARFYLATHLALIDETLYVMHPSSRIRAIDLTTRAVTALAKNLYGLAMVLDGGVLYDAGASLRRIDLVSQTVEPVLTWPSEEGSATHMVGDGHGTLWILQSLQYDVTRVRRVDLATQTSVLVGPELRCPCALGVDSSGTPWVAQSEPLAIASLGADGTLTPAPPLFRPGWVWYAAAGSRWIPSNRGLYLHSPQGELIRVDLDRLAAGELFSAELRATVDPAPRIVSLVESTEGDLYLLRRTTDHGAASIDRIAAGAQLAVPFAGRADHGGLVDGLPTEARWRRPQSIVAVGDAFYVLEAEGPMTYSLIDANRTLRRIDAGGIVTTVAGQGRLGTFLWPGTLTSDGTHVYVSDYHQVWRYSIATDSLDVATLPVCGNALEPATLAWDGAALVLAWRHALVRWSFGADTVSQLWPGNLDYCDGQDGDQNTTISSAGDGTVFLVRANHLWQLAGNAPPVDLGAVDDVRTVAIDGHGALWTMGWTGTIQRRDPQSGLFATVIGQANQHGVRVGPLPARLNWPRGIAFAPDGTMVIAEWAENALLRVRNLP